LSYPPVSLTLLPFPRCRAIPGRRLPSRRRPPVPPPPSTAPGSCRSRGRQSPYRSESGGGPRTLPISVSAFLLNSSNHWSYPSLGSTKAGTAITSSSPMRILS